VGFSISKKERKECGHDQALINKNLISTFSCARNCRENPTSLSLVPHPISFAKPAVDVKL